MFHFDEEQWNALQAAHHQKSAQRLECSLREQGFPATRDPAGGDLVVVDKRKLSTRLAFRKDGLPGKLIRPSGTAFGFEYNERRRLSAIVRPGGHRVEYRHDSTGRIAGVAWGGNPPYEIERDSRGLPLTTRFPDGKSLAFEYDDDARLTRLTDRSGAETRFERGPEGLEIIDPLGRRVAFKKTAQGALDSIHFPDGTREEFSYDPAAKIAQVRTRDGGVISYHFDDRNLPKRIQWSDGSWTAFRFGKAGELLEAKNSAEDVVRAFDDAGRLRAEQTSAGQAALAYDPDGRLLRLQDHFGETTKYCYDDDGRLTAVRDWEGREIRIAFGPDDGISEIRYPNGLVEQHQYSRPGLLQAVRVLNPRRDWRHCQSYEHDACDRLTMFADRWGNGPRSGLARSFEYDAESRLLRETDPETGALLAEYAYDAKGNMTRCGSRTIEVGPMDQPTRFGPAAIEYDARGNMVRFPGPRGEVRCVFSADNRLRRADVADQFFLTPLAFREAGKTYWLQTDVRGAVIRAFDEDGEVAWQATYDSFGQVSVSVNRVRQPWRLAGQYHDEETGLHYNFARYYHPGLKSYLSIDPSWAHPEATNYSYGRNDPWNRADPLGMIALVIAGIVAAGAVIGGVAGYMLADDDSKWGAALGGAAAGAIGAAVGVYLAGATLPFAALAGVFLAGSALAAFADAIIQELVSKGEICWPCVWKSVAFSMLFDLLLAGLGKLVPKAVKKAAEEGLARALGVIASRLKVQFISKFFSVASPTDGAVFYAGPGTQKAAEELAEKTGKTTLGQTSAGQYLDQNLNGSDAFESTEALDIWRDTSERYAQEASGEVTAVVNNPASDSVFVDTELPALLDNPNVTQITIHGDMTLPPEIANHPNADKIVFQ